MGKYWLRVLQVGKEYVCRVGKDDKVYGHTAAYATRAQAVSAGQYRACNHAT